MAQSNNLYLWTKWKTMRADRLLSMLMLLQTRKQMTAQQLAEELEVSERTIYRDITALGTAGIPICTNRGPGGGITLIDNYHSDLTGLNKDEVQALSLLNIPPALYDLGLDQQLKAAFLKLSAALPSSLRADEQYARQRIHIDFHSWEKRQQVSLPYMQVVLDAVWRNLVLSVRYYTEVGRRFGPLEADIHPYGLVARDGYWYLIGFRRDHIGVIRVDYILDARIKGQNCKPPNDFVLMDYWDNWCRESLQNRPSYPVRVRASPKVIGSLSKLFRDDQSEQFVNNEYTNLKDWITVELQFEYHEQALEILLTYGGAIEVLEPMALRYSIRDYAEQIIAVYPRKK